MDLRWRDRSLFGTEKLNKNFASIELKVNREAEQKDRTKQERLSVEQKRMFEVSKVVKKK